MRDKAERAAKPPVQWKVLLNGLVKQNPVLVLLLGTCPTLAITTSAMNALGMGLALTFVLVGSNVVISLLKNIIPGSVRIPCYIIVIAGFVTILSMVVEAYTPDLYNALGVFLPLIVVNCIVLGRAEMFASKNRVVDSMLDGVGMGLGFTATLLVMSTIREIVGNGSWFGMRILPEDAETIRFFTTPAGGFLVFGCLICIVGVVTKGKAPVRKGFDCANCPSAHLCSADYKCPLEGETPAPKADTFVPASVYADGGNDGMPSVDAARLEAARDAGLDAEAADEETGEVTAESAADAPTPKGGDAE